MTDNVENIIDKALGVVDDVKRETKKQAVIPRPKLESSDDDMDKDYKYQRENFYNLIERGQDAVEGIVELAQESEHPRAYEVAGNLIKSVADVTEKLVDLQTKMKKLKEIPETGPKRC